MSLLSVDITARYPGRPDVLKHLRLDLDAGQTTALIGQSGSGKSTLALAIPRLLDWKQAEVKGSIRWGGRELLSLRESEMRRIRGKEIALVLQSAATSLNPALRLETHFREAWKAHSNENRAAGLAAAGRLLTEVDLPCDRAFLSRYPREVSLGQAQRVLIALSLLHSPQLLLADEPTSALDVITQKEVLSLLSRLTRERHMATLFISHDLLSVAAFCQSVAILHEGVIVEQADTQSIFTAPRHPYTRQLIDALPANPFRGVSRAETSTRPLLALDSAVSSLPSGGIRESVLRPRG